MGTWHASAATDHSNSCERRITRQSLATPLTLVDQGHLRGGAFARNLFDAAVTAAHASIAEPLHGLATPGTSLTWRVVACVQRSVVSRTGKKRDGLDRGEHNG